MSFSIGDRVVKRGDPFYNHMNFSRRKIAEKGSKGTIIRMICLYRHTRQQMNLYVVHFDGFDCEDDLIDQYTSSSLTLIKK